MGSELFEKKHDFLVCIDSDGCVFDNMELKHKECFCPATVNVWNLQSVSRYAREAAEYVNLYSVNRGVNRYPGIIMTLELLGKRKEAAERGYHCPDLTSLKDWVEHEKNLSLSALKKACDERDHKDPVLETTLRWSQEVEENIARIVRGAAHFPHVEEALKAFSAFADIAIVSATPKNMIIQEWKEHELYPYASYVFGQEDGSKASCIRKAAEGRYEKDHVLMIGDAPGDYRAAQDNGVLFFPIIPGQETESWEKIAKETAEAFSEGRYSGSRMEEAVNEFIRSLKTTVPWEEV